MLFTAWKWRAWCALYKFTRLISKRTLSTFAEHVFLVRPVTKNVRDGRLIKCYTRVVFEVPDKKTEYALYSAKCIHAFHAENRKESDIHPYTIRLFIPVKCNQIEISCTCTGLGRGHLDGEQIIHDVRAGWQDITIFLKE